MARKKLIAGNWKMYTTHTLARELAEDIVKGLGSEDRVNVAVCPPFLWLTSVAESLRGSKVLLGAQDVHYAAEGAFTGEISPNMLLDSGCQCAIVGHSERRQILHEPDGVLNRKLKSALAFGLKAIYCIGETLAERDAKLTESVLDFQLSAGLAGVPEQHAARMIVAYEPVWAIGTGKTPTLDEIQHTHTFVRQLVAKRYSSSIADSLIITYGGSVKPENASGILKLPDVDGALVGGASLKAESFLAIVRAAL
jgi:triosephosphate isomerase (TIM)